MKSNLSKLKDKNKCIICCSVSGMRAGTAQKLLKSKGYKAVDNGGGWAGLQNTL